MHGVFFATDFAKTSAKHYYVMFLSFASDPNLSALYTNFKHHCLRGVDREKVKIYCLLIAMLLASVLGPVVSAKSDPAADNDSGYRVPSGNANIGSGEVEMAPDERRKKYREKITIQKDPGARYEKIIISPPAQAPAPAVRPLPRPAVMPQVAKPSAGNKRWEKYDDMTISPSDSSDPSAMFYLPPN